MINVQRKVSHRHQLNLKVSNRHLYLYISTEVDTIGNFNTWVMTHTGLRSFGIVSIAS